MFTKVVVSIKDDSDKGVVSIVGENASCFNFYVGFIQSIKEFIIYFKTKDNQFKPILFDLYSNERNFLESYQIIPSDQNGNIEGKIIVNIKDCHMDKQDYISSICIFIQEEQKYTCLSYIDYIEYDVPLVRYFKLPDICNTCV